MDIASCDLDGLGSVPKAWNEDAGLAGRDMDLTARDRHRAAVTVDPIAEVIGGGIDLQDAAFYGKVIKDHAESDIGPDRAGADLDRVSGKTVGPVRVLAVRTDIQAPISLDDPGIVAQTGCIADHLSGLVEVCVVQDILSLKDDGDLPSRRHTEDLTVRCDMAVCQCERPFLGGAVCGPVPALGSV